MDNGGVRLGCFCSAASACPRNWHSKFGDGAFSRVFRLFFYFAVIFQVPGYHHRVGRLERHISAIFIFRRLRTPSHGGGETGGPPEIG